MCTGDGRSRIRVLALEENGAGQKAVFPPMVTRMIAVGEETGDVDGMLGKIADFYESEVDATVYALN